MRKIYFLCVTALTIMVSCSSDELTYSCDREINQWVKDNIESIQQMDRSDWLSVSGEMSIATYRAFTYQQRIRFWQDKFTEVKQLPWKDNELRHIELAENFIALHPYFFNSKQLTEEQNDELDLFFYKWLEDGINELGWTKAIGISIVGTGYKLKNTYGEIELPVTTYAGHNMRASVERDCNCNTGIISDFCYLIGHECSDLNCNDTGIGCGWLLLQSCNGRCD